jgi:hypothetical protein
LLGPPGSQRARDREQAAAFGRRARRAYRGTSAERKAAALPVRDLSFGSRTGTRPMPVTIIRCGCIPFRTTAFDPRAALGSATGPWKWRSSAAIASTIRERALSRRSATSVSTPSSGRAAAGETCPFAP